MPPQKSKGNEKADFSNGVFNGDAWEGTDLLASNLSVYNNTIKVIDGVLQP
jgi:hypothetical protein